MVNLPTEYSDNQVTPFGGMSLMKSFLNQTKFREFLSTLNLPQPGSDRGYAPPKLSNLSGQVFGQT
jgi:hypothetical protein